MRKRRMVILGLAIGSWLAIACSSGSGGLIELGDGYERAPDLRENPGSGREAPPSSGDNPGSQGGGPSSSGGSSSGGGSTCPACDVKLDCLTGNDKVKITLKTENGQCSAGDGVTFDCTGKVFLNGTAIGTWQAAGTGYVVTVTDKGQTQSLTCTVSTTTTVPTGTGTTTAPTPTTTSVPPDAGTKTCADLLACCAKIANASLKSSCTSTYTALNGNNASCSAAYPSYASSCP